MLQIPKGVDAYLPVSIYDASRQLANIDEVSPGVPNAQIRHVMVNGTIQNIAGVQFVQQQDSTPAKITGRYQIKVPTANLNYNDQVQIHFRVVVNGFTLDEDTKFLIVNQPAALPYIDTV